MKAMAKPKHPPPPAHLADTTKQWWRSVLHGYVLEPHHLRLLQAACEAWDRLQQARVELARDGLTVQTADGGRKAHPCLAVERDSRTGFARLLRELALDVEAPAEGARPPPLRGQR